MSRLAADLEAVAPYGWMDNEMTPFFPRVNCLSCGRFVGRDGWLNIEYFEMSSVVASLDGECRSCAAAALGVEGEQENPT